jgi:hypothetical protein
LDAACELISRFAVMLVNLRGQEKLEQWTTDADAGSLPELRGFATGPAQGSGRPHVRTVATGTRPSGRARQPDQELKRQVFGRAQPDLLRKRVLLAS